MANPMSILEAPVRRIEEGDERRTPTGQVK